MRPIFALMLMFLLGSPPAFAESIEGLVVSINAEARDVTLDGGEVMHMTDNVAINELVIGQLVRLDYEPGTVNVSSATVLDEAAPPPLSEEPIAVDE